MKSHIFSHHIIKAKETGKQNLNEVVTKLQNVEYFKQLSLILHKTRLHFHQTFAFLQPNRLIQLTIQ